MANVIRTTDRMRRYPGADGVTVAAFVDLPIGVSVESLTFAPGTEVSLTQGDDDGEGFFLTHGEGWVTSPESGREQLVAGNIVYFSRYPDLVLGTDSGMIVLRIRGGFLMPGP